MKKWVFLLVTFCFITYAVASDGFNQGGGHILRLIYDLLAEPEQRTIPADQALLTNWDFTEAAHETGLYTVPATGISMGGWASIAGGKSVESAWICLAGGVAGSMVMGVGAETVICEMVMMGNRTITTRAEHAKR